MVYSQFYLKNQTKVPTVIAVLFVFLIGIFFIRLFTRSAIPSKAEKKIVRRIEVANISSNQAVVYWQTDQKDVGWVIYGNNPNTLSKLAYDERDLSSNKNAYPHHYVVLKDLSPNQTYFFKLISDNRIIANNGSATFSFKTMKNNTDFRNREPAYGKIIEANGGALENAIVLLRVGNSSPLAVLTKATGEWLIPLNALYDKDTYQQMTPGNKDKVIIEVFSNSKTSQVTTDLSKVSPLPQSVIIGTDFNFTVADNVLSATSSRTADASEREIDIIYPRENALIPGSTPLIKGVALPNRDVFITVHSDTVFSSRVKADSKGAWVLNLPSSLTSGDHTITIKTTDREGNTVTIERKFIIAKNGEQVLGEATAEPSITSPPDTPTPTTQVYFTPTKALTPKPPVSGGNISVPLVGAASFIIVGIGLLLVF